MLAQQTVDQVKQIQDIVAIIQEYMQLTKKGRNYVGLCPFHGEKTPSFTVSPEKRIFHCFGCHESGDHITFVMKMDNLTFTEAIKQLATKNGIEIIEEERKGGFDRERDDILDCIYHTREYYIDQLNKHPAVMTYLTERGLTKESIEAFHIGYSPNQFPDDRVINGKTFPPELLIKAGVAHKNNSGMILPKFYNRLMFPIVDYLGRTVGFSGRTLDQSGDKKIAKYINSEETNWFTKRRLLYGLYHAKKHIKKQDQVILVEGYMDVIMAHQFGFENVVATMGTALTQAQIQKINRFTQNVILGLDSDEAGQAAIERSYEGLKEKEMSVRVLNFQDKDPADLLLDHGKEAFQKTLDNAQTMLEFKLNNWEKIYSKDDSDEVAKFINACVPILKLEKEAVVKNRLVRLLSQRLDVKEEIILAKLKNIRYNIKSSLTTKVAKDKFHKAEEYLLYLLAADLDIRDLVKQNYNENLFANEMYRSLATICFNSTNVDQELVHSIEEEELRKELVQILLKGDGAEYNNYHWKELVRVLQARHKEQSIAMLTKEIAECEKTQNFQSIPEKLKQLKELLHANKEG